MLKSQTRHAITHQTWHLTHKPIYFFSSSFITQKAGTSIKGKGAEQESFFVALEVLTALAQCHVVLQRYKHVANETEAKVIFPRTGFLKDKFCLSNLFAKSKLVTSARLVRPSLCTWSLHHMKHTLSTVYNKFHPFTNCTFKQTTFEGLLMGAMRSGCDEALTHLLIFHFTLSALCTCVSPYFKAQF